MEKQIFTDVRGYTIMSHDFFCANQVLDNDNKIYCLQKAVEGYNCICPYERKHLITINGKELPQKNPCPNADGICQDYEPLSHNVNITENFIG